MLLYANMLLSNKCTSEDNIGRIESDAKDEYVSINPNAETDDNEYQVMHSANELGPLDCPIFSHPPKGQFKRINLVPLPAVARSIHPTNNETNSHKKAISNSKANQNWQSRILSSIKLSPGLSKSQEIQNGKFVKQKDFKGDYYYFSGGDGTKNPSIVYEDFPNEPKDINRQTNSPLVFKKTFSCKDAGLISNQLIIPRRTAPQPPPRPKASNNFVPKTIAKKGKTPNLAPNPDFFEDITESSEFSKHIAQLKAQYESHH